VSEFVLFGNFNQTVDKLTMKMPLALSEQD